MDENLGSTAYRREVAENNESHRDCTAQGLPKDINPTGGSIESKRVTNNCSPHFDSVTTGCDNLTRCRSFRFSILLQLTPPICSGMKSKSDSKICPLELAVFIRDYHGVPSAARVLERNEYLLKETPPEKLREVLERFYKVQGLICFIRLLNHFSRFFRTQ
ncbi:MAG: hypothetical protein ACPGFB_15775 [Verrucomicrobiales bacterium]